MRHSWILGLIIGAIAASYTPYSAPLMVVVISFGLVMALILATRKAEWEAPARKRKADSQTISTPPNNASYSLVSALPDDSTQPIDTEALEASLEDEDLPDTSPPESAAVLQAIQYLEDLEG